jgi:hypothetical protein
LRLDSTLVYDAGTLGSMLQFATPRSLMLRVALTEPEPDFAIRHLSHLVDLVSTLPLPSETLPPCGAQRAARGACR